MFRILTLILACLSAAAPTTGTTAGDNFGRGLTMAEAMMNMMERMGMFGSGTQDTPGSTTPPGEPWNPWRQDFAGSPNTAWRALPQGFGLAPGAVGATAPRNRFRPPQGWGGAAPESQGAQGPASQLEGDWQSNTGERLRIHAGRFRLQSGPTRTAEGMIRLNGRLLSLYLPELRRTLVYEYAEYQGRLALRDAEGRIFLYRRTTGTGGGPNRAQRQVR
jgi:hypothetical protein